MRCDESCAGCSREPAPLRPEHARELEGELMAAFGQLYPEQEVVPMKRLWLRKALVVAAAAVVCGAAACVAPADVEVPVGRSISIQVADGAELPEPEALMAAVRGEAKTERRARVMVRGRRGDGATTLTLDVWGDEVPEGDVAERIRAAFPALAGAEIREDVLAGTVHGTLGAKLGHGAARSGRARQGRRGGGAAAGDGAARGARSRGEGRRADRGRRREAEGEGADKAGWPPAGRGGDGASAVAERGGEGASHHGRTRRRGVRGSSAAREGHALVAR